MPLDFNSTKQFRDFILSRTLQYPNGPQTFTENNYRYKTTSNFANVDPGAVDTNRKADLLQTQNTNVYKPLNYSVKEQLDVIPRRANLSLYYNGTPYFISGNHSLVSIINNGKYENESELFKFAASYIQDKNQKGPVYSRIEQNLYTATIGRVRLIDALSGNLATAVNIVTGKEPLVERNYKITVAKTPIGKGIDFLQTVAGVEFPWTEIPGDYLSNPNNPINVRPVPNSQFGKVFQDATGALGSLLGIQRRPTQSRKPSDLFIEYMGSGQKQALFDMLSYSKYAPNYTTTARSQNTSKLFNFVDNFAQGVKNALGVEAPNSVAYIGDDRGNDVKFAMNDFNGRPVRSPYYLSLLFDPVQTKLFENKKNITEGGQISGKLTWISRQSKNKLGINNQQYSSQSSKLEDSLSTKFEFRDESILGYTQDILDSLPTNGGEARSHIANVIDQTSRIFREGNVYLSKASAIKYVNKFGMESGVEYCRTWTKDRPYISYSDTMKKGGNIRKYEGTIVSDPWNLNIAPMSNGKKDFASSTNIFKGYTYGVDDDGKSFYAKKYMFSIENLAWKTSNKKGFTVLDLAYCERGPNGGRVMWFPPYDLKVSENNQANWESNRFLGRPEPIYTYSNTERTGNISFKIVVDHPSILNLLVREEFKNLSDEEADNYINAIFAGCESLDFYDLIRRYTVLDKTDIDNIIAYLNKGQDKTVVKNFAVVAENPTQNSPEVTTTTTTTEPGTKTEKLADITLHFDNAEPKTKTDIITQNSYTDTYNQYIGKKSYYTTTLTQSLTSLNAFPTNDKDAINDRNIIYGSNITTGASLITDQVSKITKYFDTLESDFVTYTGKTNTLKEDLKNKNVKDITVTISSSTSAPDTVEYNKRLSFRRSYSVVKDFLNRINGENKDFTNIKWFQASDINSASPITKNFEYSFKEIGYEYEGKLTIKVTNHGESWSDTKPNTTIDNDCLNKNFKKVTKLNVVAPIQYFCRKSTINYEYTKTETPKPPVNPEPPKVIPATRIQPNGTTTIPSKAKKPPIDVMKRIIMKTLSECYYFKKLEEDSPLVFSSIREKLKYFHPAFHSTTPEGLNSRLTFLQQCIRPGDTIPIKGISDDSDLNARNTTFGPPPICILRIGDFYHSKVVIRDVNISYDDSTWDMNPEGIGFQPMIANVQMSVNFIGGHGLEEPVAQLQNALSSNFYANTEIYDERAKATNKKIQGMEAEAFTKDFLQKLMEKNKTPEPNNQNDGKVIKEGYIGKFTSASSNNNLEYTTLVDNLFTKSENYIKQYAEMYNIVIPKYGKILSSILLSQNYRDINTYQITKGNNTTEDIGIFGTFKKGVDVGRIIKITKEVLLSEIDNSNLCNVFGFDSILPPQKIDRTNRLLIPEIKKIVTKKLDELSEDKTLGNFEKNRNELISSLDPLNFIVKYERDFQYFSGKTYEVELSGFTRNLLYDEYSYCIDYVKNNSTSFYNDLDNSINFKNPTFTAQNVSDILSVLIKDDVQNIINLFKTDTTLYDSNTINKLTKQLNEFISIIPQKLFKFKAFKPRVNTNKISYNILTTTETTNANMIDEGKKLNSTIVEVDSKLNYYKIKIQ